MSRFDEFFRMLEDDPVLSSKSVTQVYVDGIEVLNGVPYIGGHHRDVAMRLCEPGSNLKPVGASDGVLKLSMINPLQPVDLLEDHPFVTRSSNGKYDKVLPTDHNRELLRQYIYGNTSNDAIKYSLLSSVASVHYNKPDTIESFKHRTLRFIELGDMPLRNYDIYKCIDIWGKKVGKNPLEPRLDSVKCSNMHEFFETYRSDDASSRFDFSDKNKRRVFPSEERIDSISQWLSIRNTSLEGLFDGMSDDQAVDIFSAIDDFMSHGSSMRARFVEFMESSLEIPDGTLFKAFDVVNAVHFGMVGNEYNSLRSLDGEDMCLAEVVSETTQTPGCRAVKFDADKGELFIEAGPSVIADFKAFCNSEELSLGERKLVNDYLENGSSAKLEELISAFGIPCNGNFGVASGQSVMDVAFGFRHSVGLLEQEDARWFFMEALHGADEIEPSDLDFLTTRDLLYKSGVSINLASDFDASKASDFTGHLYTLPYPVITFQDVMFSRTSEGGIESWPLRGQSDEEVRNTEQLLAYYFYGSNQAECVTFSQQGQSKIVNSENDRPVKTVGDGVEKEPHPRRATFAIKPFGRFSAERKVSYVRESFVHKDKVETIDMSRFASLPVDRKDLVSKIFETRLDGFASHNEAARRHPDAIKPLNDLSDYRVVVDVKADLLKELEPALKGVKVQASARMNDGEAIDFDF